MKIYKLIIFLMGLTMLHTACSKSDDTPYIILKDSSGKIIRTGEKITVNLNTKTVIYTEIGYKETENADIHYNWKIDDSLFEKFTSFDGLNITTIGIRNNLSIEKASLEIYFSDQLVKKGSTVTLRVQDKTSSEVQINFNVQ